MKKALLILLLLPLFALGADHYLATLNSSGASVSYTARRGAHLSIQCSSAAYVTTGAGSATATATNGVKIPADALFDVTLTGRDDTIAELPVSGSNTCGVFVSSY